MVDAMPVRAALVCPRCPQTFPDWYSLSVHWIKVEKQSLGKAKTGGAKVWRTEDMERICRELPKRFRAERDKESGVLLEVKDLDDSLVFTEQEDGEWRGREI